MTITKNADGTYTLTPTAVEQRVITGLKLEYNATPVDPVSGQPRGTATDARVLMTIIEGELRIQRERLVAINAGRRDAAYVSASAASQAAADTALGFVSFL